MEGRDLTDVVLSWSLQDVSNSHLYEDKVERIPDTFLSAQHYASSFVYPLLEETRAELFESLELIANAPLANVICINKADPKEELLYNARVDYRRNMSAGRGLVPYRTLPGDLVIFSVSELQTFSDVQRLARKTWAFALITEVLENEDESAYVCFKVRVSKETAGEGGMIGWGLMYSLINITTNERIFEALRMFPNVDIIKEVLGPDPVGEETFEYCPECSFVGCPENRCKVISSKLNKSQMDAALTALHKIQCNNKASFELICGPPGTGKTRTISALLCALLEMNIRTLTCAPNAVAVKEVASRVLTQLKQSFETDPLKDESFFSLGDLLCFIENDTTSASGSEIKEMCLNHRVEKLAVCFDPLNGWRHSFISMIDFFEDDNLDELLKMERVSIKDSKGDRKTYLPSITKKFKSTSLQLREVVIAFCTHIPKTFILEKNFQGMLSLLGFLSSFESMLDSDKVVSAEIESHFARKGNVKHSSKSSSDSPTLMDIRNECLHILKDILNSLMELQFPESNRKELLMDFCFQTASSIFSTVSDSHRLRMVDMKPLNVLVIDEAAQVKESESKIPLQLPGIKLAILVGDKFQLPSTLKSNICGNAGYGRSLYERLSSLGYAKHVLSMQYRMHPSISLFPSSCFYANEIWDAANVRHKTYEMKYLSDPFSRPYLFINVSCGREEVDDVGLNVKNMVEVAVLVKMVQNVYQAWRSGAKQELRIGILSPYTAQVIEIEEKLRWKYENKDGFSLKVQTIDGFQGGESDIILISTVRANDSGYIGFMADPKIINVALTRARHCLWILGSERTLTISQSVWADIVHDAKNRHCLFNADEDCDLANVLLNAKAELHQLDDLLNRDSSLFNGARWKVIFSDNCRKVFNNLKSSQTKKMVITLLLRLSNGWRPKKCSIDLPSEKSSMIFKKFKVGYLYIVCSNDLVKEYGYFTQVLKVWDILPLEDIPKLVEELDCIFEVYTDEYISRCKKKCLEGELEIPASWTGSYAIVQHKSSGNLPCRISNGDGFGSRYKKPIVSESFLLMKFYSLTCNMVQHLISGRDGRELHLPFELTDEEQETVLFNRSSFILGRSGTGKTTVLAQKLFQREQIYYIASEGLCEVEHDWSMHSSQRNKIVELPGDAKRVRLRQLFVVVSPRLCNAVKQQLSHFQSFASGREFIAESSSLDFDYNDDTLQFKDIPDSFVNIPPESYPLVITLHKFLMMLDGTVGISYFSRFPNAHKLARTVTLQNFIRSREVNHERFVSSYWPYFNAHLTKHLDCSVVFTEIMSHIKGGGLEAGNAHEGRLSRDHYLSLSESRVSTLTRNQRDKIYDIFLKYEEKKIKKGEYDISDLVIDLHFRLRTEIYGGDHIDFVYIDEVQDLTMRQIALFKYVCKNVDEGFVFSGDTAQAIAKGVHFRFQDIRHLFFKEFVLGSQINATDKKEEKGKISQILHLRQNFRTHAGVLNLAQTVIDLLYHFFPLTIDALKPETSLIHGEAPVLIESGNFQDALSTIFGNSGNASGIVSFGAKQVILVRDDSAKDVISEYVGKKALVLTISESKGLEFQLFNEHNYEMASLCFEKAGDTYNQKLATAAKIYAHANSVSSTKPQIARKYFTEAADIFEDIGRVEFAAKCFFKIKMYEKAGRMYMERCAEPRLDKAGECFSLAGCYESAAEAYAKANLFSECLAVCIKGKLFCMGLQFMQQWKQTSTCDEMVGRTQTTDNEQYLLNEGALHFYKLQDKLGMLKFVRAFHSMDKRRSFLRELGCLDELLLLEEEFGYFLEAANIAKAIGDVQCQVHMLEKGGQFRQASMIILWQFFINALPTHTRKISPLVQFTLEDLTKAKSIANKHSCLFFSFICDGVRILTDVIREHFLSHLQFVQYWKRNAPSDIAIEETHEIHEIEQDLLQRCALHYHELKDQTGMMKHVRAFDSMEKRRSFLLKLGCLDELISLEEEFGHFLEAANVAKSKGDVKCQVHMLEKGGYFREASMIILLQVFINALPIRTKESSNAGQFTLVDLTEAKLIAQKHSPFFYRFIYVGVEILTDENIIRKDFLSQLQQFVQYWKWNAPSDVAIKETLEIHRIEQDVLQRCALHYHELKDLTNMMKYVRAFHSMASIRSFLWGLFCLDELLLIENEKGNSFHSAEIAKWIGDISLEVEMLEKAQTFEDSSFAILQFVLVHSLWQPGSKGWPLKWFNQKINLVNKAKINAERASKHCHEFISTECEILSEEQCSLFLLNQYFSSSHIHGSIRGQILCAWKIIDAHLHLISALEGSANHDLFTYLTKYFEEEMSSNQSSIENLGCLWIYWNFWKDEIVNVLAYLDHSSIHAPTKKYQTYEEFCLNYLGVLKHYKKGYLMLNPEAAWAKGTDNRFLHTHGKFVFISGGQFEVAAKTYWHSELISVGRKLLENLETLYQFCTKNSFPLICQSIPLIYIFDLTNFLIKRELRASGYPNAETLRMILESSTEAFFSRIYPLDWRQSSTEYMVSLRENKLAVNLLRELVHQNIKSKGNHTFGQIGRAVMIMLGSGELLNEFAKEFNVDSPWMNFIERLCFIKRSRQLSKCSASPEKEISLILKLWEALEVTYNANWREEIDFVSPVCFMYIMERLLFLVSYEHRLILATKSMVVEWLLFEQWRTKPSASSSVDMSEAEKSQMLGDAYSFMASVVHGLLWDEEGTKEWLKKSYSNVGDYPVLVLRLVVIMCLICGNSGKHFDLLSDLLGKSHIRSCLPKPFCDAFLGRQKNSFVQVLAKALKQIESELVLVKWGSSHFHFSHAILLDNIGKRDKVGILNELFPKGVSSYGNAFEPESSYSFTADQKLKLRKEVEENNLQENYEHFCDIFNALKPFENANDVGMETLTSNLPMMVVLTEKTINLLTTVMTEYFQRYPCDSEDEDISRIHCQDGNLLWHANIMVDNLKQLSHLLNDSSVQSATNLKNSLSRIRPLLKKLQSGKARLEPFIRQICFRHAPAAAAVAGSRITEDILTVDDAEEKTAMNDVPTTEEGK